MPAASSSRGRPIASARDELQSIGQLRTMLSTAGSTATSSGREGVARGRPSACHGLPAARGRRRPRRREHGAQLADRLELVAGRRDPPAARRGRGGHRARLPEAHLALSKNRPPLLRPASARTVRSARSGSARRSRSSTSPARSSRSWSMSARPCGSRSSATPSTAFAQSIPRSTAVAAWTSARTGSRSRSTQASRRPDRGADQALIRGLVRHRAGRHSGPLGGIVEHVESLANDVTRMPVTVSAEWHNTPVTDRPAPDHAAPRVARGSFLLRAPEPIFRRPAHAQQRDALGPEDQRARARRRAQGHVLAVALPAPRRAWRSNFERGGTRVPPTPCSSRTRGTSRRSLRPRARGRARSPRCSACRATRSRSSRS